ncbi:hypothetical protein HAX54_006353, partial [Datura stramonium]|nr:hypothetical protein [Datura stramonium]
KRTEVAGLVQRVKKELMTRQPLDGLSHQCHGSDSMNDDRQASVGPSWPTSRLDNEGDGPST